MNRSCCIERDFDNAKRVEKKAENKKIYGPKVRYMTIPPATSRDDLTPWGDLSVNSCLMYEKSMKKFFHEVGYPPDPPDDNYIRLATLWINTPKSVSGRSIRRLSVLRGTGIAIDYDHRTAVARTERKLTRRKAQHTEADIRHMMRHMVDHATEEERCIAAFCWYFGVRSSEISLIKFKRSRNNRIYLDLSPRKGNKKRNIDVTDIIQDNPVLQSALQYYAAHFKGRDEPLSLEDARKVQSAWAVHLRQQGYNSDECSYHALRHAAITRERQKITDRFLADKKDFLTKKLKNAKREQVLNAYFACRGKIEEELSNWSGHKDIDSVRSYGTNNLYAKLSSLVS